MKESDKEKNMKKQRIKNRVYLSILIAILMQCVIFGGLLLSTGIYASIAEEPYRILRAQMEEKNTLVSRNMNSTLLEGKRLFEQIQKEQLEAQIQQKIVESLSRQASVSGILYSDLTSKKCVYFVDSEPTIPSAGFGDISCRIGLLKTEYNIALDTKWRGSLNDGEWESVREYLADSGNKNRWSYYNGALYYVIVEADGENIRLLALELERSIIESMLRLDQPAYEGMQVVITEEDSILYGSRYGEGREISVQEDDIFTVDINGERYVGIRGQLQNYGRIQNDNNLYIGLMCKEKAITKLGREVTARVVLAYAVSILTAATFAYLALRQVMKPWNQLHEDIKKQNVRKIHFEETGVAEVDNIYEALNTMTAQLERSYARYAFAMEAAEEHLGSFEYQYGKDEVIASPSVKHILQIPDDMYLEENKIGVENWTIINTRMHPVEGLDGYLYQGNSAQERYITIQTREEASGIFGVIIDKTEEYRKITSLQYISEHDHLTGLYNGAYFREAGQKILDSTGWKRSRQTIQAVVFCDLDNLKAVNDNYGHVGGDAYLAGMASWLKSITEKEDAIVARMSGDEFAILFYGYDSCEEILMHLDEAYEKRPSLALPDGHSIQLSASIGIAFHTGKDGNLEDLLQEADQAMYLKKHSSKNGIRVYERQNNK